MIRVKNKKAVAVLSRKSLSANRTRNAVAILAIILTTLMFTSLFTISGSIVNAYQQSTFRQLGGDAHGTFKNITEDQIAVLANDPEITNYGVRMLVGMPSQVPFNKAHVEVSYMDETCAKAYFCLPEVGTLPAAETNQIACDTRILKLLGITPQIGAEVVLTYDLGSSTDNPQSVTDTFVLSGWWTYDPASAASHAIVSKSYADAIIDSYTRTFDYDITGRWDMNVYLKSTAHIESDLLKILTRNGYQTTDRQAENYIATGVNWAYVGAQIYRNVDLGTVLGIALILILIIFTGYLIIYNIFQISVTNDIRFYGLLKTIGVTAKQIRFLIRRQALLLSAFGIPMGLLAGYFLGNVLAPHIINTLTFKSDTYQMVFKPWIFLLAAGFSIVTILISVRKPGRIAGRVSPIEAIRYTESNSQKRKAKRGERTSIMQMAFSNLRRTTKKTIIVITSLSLAVVLLNLTYTFTNGFDMDKYLRAFVASDFVASHASYFQTGARYDSDTSVPETYIEAIEATGNVLNGGRIYGLVSGDGQEAVSEARFREKYSVWNDQETVDTLVEVTDRLPDGQLLDSVQLYGMEDDILSRLTLVEGDIESLKDPNRHTIAAVCRTDDYDHPELDSNWARIGDQVTLRYIEAWAFFDPDTGEMVEDGQAQLRDDLIHKPSKWQDITYEVTAMVTVDHPLSYRYYNSDAFVLPADVYVADSGHSDILLYAFDVADDKIDAMNAFLKNYTKSLDPEMDYESKQTYADEFEHFKSMFLLMGGVLSGIIGMVGILNFFNAILTSIVVRRHEFAMLQAIGMTGKQLRKMLVIEGVLLSGMAAGVSLFLSIVASPFLDRAMSSTFWFFSYRFSVMPIVAVTPIFLILGVAVPQLIYPKETIVERLRMM